MWSFGKQRCTGQFKSQQGRENLGYVTVSDRCVNYCMRVEEQKAFLPGSGTGVPSKELVPAGQEI